MMNALLLFYASGVILVFGVSVFFYTIVRKTSKHLPLWVMYLSIGGAGYLFFAQYLKYRSLHMYVDFAHWLQVLQSVTTNGWPEVLSQEFIFPGTLNYFSAHFVPLIYLFAIPFKLFPYPATLIVLNVALMLSSAIPLYKLVMTMSGNKRLALLLATVFLWYPTFQYITLYEFEMLRFSIPVLLWMLYFWERRRMRWYFFFVILAILVREEVGLTIAMFGIYIFFFERKRVAGLSTALLGFIAFTVITQRIMPALSNTVNFEHIAAGIAPQLGYTPFTVIKNSILHPLLLLKIVLHPVKLANIGMLFLPLIFLPFFGASVLLSIIANVGIGLMSTSFAHSSYMLYYIAPSVPFIFYALIKAWPKMMRRLNEVPLMYALLAAVLISNIFFGPSPISLQFWFHSIRPAPFRTQDFHYSVYLPNERERYLSQFTARIPNGAIVATQQFLAPRFFRMRGIMAFPQLESKDGKYRADYIFLDRTNNRLSSGSPAFIGEQEFSALAIDNRWRLVASEGPYTLYQRTE